MQMRVWMLCGFDWVSIITTTRIGKTRNQKEERKEAASR